MKKILGFVVLSLFAISASAADLMASSTAPTVTQNIVVEGAACPGVGATGFSSTGLLLSCQSGVWEMLFQIDGDSTNYTSGDYSWTTCADYPCLQVSKTFTITKPKAFVAYAQTNAGLGKDSISTIHVNGSGCAVSRMPSPGGGIWSYANSACVKWLPPGTHTITLRAYGNDFNGSASGGILLM